MEEHEIDQLGVDRFRLAMLEKLAIKRLEGRGGWHDPEQCAVSDLHAMLLDHVEKGDMIDIANFAMMIWNREQSSDTKQENEYGKR